MKIRFTTLITILCLLSACQKDKVNNTNPDMIGDWFHHTGPGYFYSIYIFKNGRGYIYEKNAADNGLDTQGRAWLVKGDKLIFSRFKREEYAINQYPTVATSKIVDGYDTIRTGETYMILNKLYFRKSP